MKRPILYCVIPFCIGIALAKFFKIPILPSLVLTILFLIFTAIFFKSNVLSHAFLYIAMVFFGIAYYQNYNILPANHIANFVSEERTKIMIKGRVADDPFTTDALYGKKKKAFTLRTEALRLLRRPAFDGTPRNNEEYNVGDYDWQTVTGLVKTSIYSDEEIKDIGFGDEVIMKGNLSKPRGLKNSGLFDYTEYLKIKNIYAVFNSNSAPFGSASSPSRAKSRERVRYEMKHYAWDWMQKCAYKLRHAIRDTFDRYLKAPYSGFINAILIGDRTELESALTDDFIKTGTVHILAISGLHVGLIGGIFLFFFRMLNVPKKANLILTLILLFFYSYVAGSSPPIIRTTIIFSISVFGFLIMRETDILNSLSIAAILILLYNPKELFDPSFQLSFLSVASIVIFSPKVEKVFGLITPQDNFVQNRMRVYILKGVSVSIAAWLGVWPLVSTYFNIISPIAILANLVVIPALFLLLILSFVFIGVSLISDFFATALAGVMCPLEHVLFAVNRNMSEIPFSYFRTPSPSMAFVVLYYALIFSLIAPEMIRFAGKDFRKPYLLVACLLFLNILCWKGAASAYLGDSSLNVTFLDVGHGDSALIEFPRKGTLLVDGGTGGEDEFDVGKNVIAPYLWNKGINIIDAVVVTHFHKDHAGGIPYILKNFKVGYVITNGARTHKNTLYDEFKKIVTSKGIPNLNVREGDEIKGFAGTKIFVLNPEANKSIIDSNENSIVLKIVCMNKSFLLCADAVGNALERLNLHKSFLKSDILKVPHHGTNLGEDAVIKKFLKNISPKFSVISVGQVNSESPCKTVLDTLTSLNSVSYETRKNGAINIKLDNGSFEIMKNS